MEDCHRIVPTLLETESSNYSYFGVYDGHGGRQIVEFLEETLENNILNELKQDDDASIPERLTRAFLITDMESKQKKINSSGATAVCGLLKTEFNSERIVTSRVLYTANAGDSRAVLVFKCNESVTPPTSSGYEALRLSYDHRGEDESEQQRVKDAGGFIAKSRVLGILAVTRSFGDHGMKDFVTAQPHLSETIIDGIGLMPFLILACDGVWDVLTDQEAADLILEKYLIDGPFEDAAELLVKTALNKGSTDNITAIVIFF
eukprot:CAMPEP_0196765438 /NCGR_PEP_ID=MMETSP1095-20130614/8835_1 /TAXON_ID=96789 ORGANISM="Chromulina nebulosa, Strain UTEXLB2642" /NCGR_SAMPLE_ID=MMETSP1095 /ASSEMBLY_ACC=CAM_ASM_000446 /LENGTH=260 /DNA_ID=CAMNT_0042123469 /DNA_START=77 /DNA_END=859 /DNA_ORIENTATION=-